MDNQLNLTNSSKFPNSFHETGERLDIEQMRQLLDSFVRKFDENKNYLTDIKSIKEIIDFLSHSNEIFLSETMLLNHRIFIVIRDFYLNLLQRWRYGEKFDEKFASVFETIANIFMKISIHISDKNLSIFKSLIFHDGLIHELNLFLEDLSRDGKYLYEPQIKGIDHLFRTIQRIERISNNNKKDFLFDNIVKCVCSTSFMEIFRQSMINDNDHPGGKFVLNTCTDYIYSHSTDKCNKQGLIDIRQSLLCPFTEWLNQQSSSYRLWNNRMIIIIRQICFLLTLPIQLNPHSTIEKDLFQCYCQLVDSCTNILYSITQSDSLTNSKSTQSLIGTLIPNFYTMTLSNQLETYIQNKHIASLILKLARIDNDEIQLNSFKILSLITAEQDTKSMIYSKNLVQLFIEFFSKLGDEYNQTLTFCNLLRCLKNLIHYDQIKDEFLKQNGFALVLCYSIESKHKSIQIQQIAFEILAAFTFHNEGYQQIQTNLNHIKPFLSSSHSNVSRAVQIIFWKLEKEKQGILKRKSDDKKHQFNIVFSFSQSDKDLSFQIYNELIKDDLLIWIDQDETCGITIQEKCEIIDDCDYFIICMSDSYKQNVYCQCESYYAHERQCQIIPIIVTSNCRNDSWLSRIINGKYPIDFVKQDFQLALMKLKNEISRQRRCPKVNSKKDVTFSPNTNIIEYSMKTHIEYPNDIDQWTHDDVKLFLTSNNLDSLLPIFGEMNGILLHELYQMCLSNRERMFHTLKAEISTLNSTNQPLTLLIYLRFLSEIQKYIPTSLINQKL